MIDVRLSEIIFSYSELQISSIEEIKMKKSALVCAVAVACTFSVWSSGSAYADDTRYLRLATDHTHDFVTTVALREFADDVAKSTNNRVKIEVYDGGQLGEEKACLEQVQFGALDMTKNSLAPLTEFVPNLNALNLPYLFRDVDHMWKVMGGEIGDQFLKEMEGMNVEGLCWIDAGSRDFYSIKPLEKAADLKGQKIRVQESQIMLHMVEALGGIPVPMPAGDVYSSLQTGVVEAAENNVPRYLDMSHQEVAKNLILDRHNILPEVLLISKQTMGSLPEEDQNAIREAAKRLQASMVEKWAKAEQDVLDKLKTMGVTIVSPDAATIADFRKACQPVYDKEGAEFTDIVKKIESVK